MKHTIFECDLCGYRTNPDSKLNRKFCHFVPKNVNGVLQIITVFGSLTQQMATKHVCMTCADIFSPKFNIPDKENERGANETNGQGISTTGPVAIEDSQTPPPVVSGASFEISKAGPGKEEHRGQSKTVLFKSNPESGETRQAGEGPSG